LHIFGIQYANQTIPCIMNEELFQYLWEHGLFRPEMLFTTEGEAVVVQHRGLRNHNAGPDFLNARIKIGDKIWVGNVELHVRSSDWLRHGHARNKLYQNIILHVVWQEDKPLDNASFPTLALKEHIAPAYVDRYARLMALDRPVACAGHTAGMSSIAWGLWLDCLLADRWEQKLAEWRDYWEQSGNDWRTLFYYRLAANFGFHVNRDAFLELALSLPLEILSRHRDNLVQVEALLFGQAGLLQAQTIQDDYTAALEKEYHFLRRKYSLVPLQAHRWKFMRMRPSNFPTLRIAQFAMFIHKGLDFFSRIMEVRDAALLMPLLSVHASSYWDNHYRLGELSAECQVKHLGKDAFYNILINTVAPMQHLYARSQGRSALIENSVQLLQHIPPEKNRVMRVWEENGITAGDAAQSQALLQLFQEYCSRRRCLECRVGNQLLSARFTSEK